MTDHSDHLSDHHPDYLADAVDLGPDPVSPAPDPDPRSPRLRLPAGAWDMHCHVFGPVDLFPYPPDARFHPPEAGADTLMHLHETLGLEHALLVQTNAHGTDHRAMLHALRLAQGRYRGVALLGDAVPDPAYDDLDREGVCGLRLNYLPHLGGAPAPAVVDRALGLVRRLGWHLELHVAGSGILDYEQDIARMDVPVVIDHLARFDLDHPDAPARIEAVLRLLGLGHVWLKVSGIDRLSLRPPPFEDAVEVASRFVTAAPDRTLWGTDFPHPNSSGWLPSDAARVELLPRIALSPAALERLLVTNPRRLLGLA